LVTEPRRIGDERQVGALASTLEAQLETLRKQEEELQFPAFTNMTAYAVGTRIVERALRERKSVAVRIERNGETLFYARMDGTTNGNDRWISRKNNTVRRFGHSSYYMHVYYKSIGSKLEDDGLDPDAYAAEGGAFPLIVQGEGIVGTIAVSGLPGEEDHGMIVDAVRDVLSQA